MSDLRRPDVVTVAVTRMDGGLTVVRVVTTEYVPDGNGERVVSWSVTPTPEYIDGIIRKYGWQGGEAAASWRIVPNEFLDEDTDQTFRDAWKDDGGHKPGHDMAKARNIHRERLRETRAALLEQLDADYMKADERGDEQEKKRIAERKQVLRDITADPRIEAAQTPDELMAIGIA